MIGKRIRGRLANALDRRFADLASRVDALQVSIDRQNEQSEQRAHAEAVMQASLAGLEQTVNGELSGMIRAIATEEAPNRRALFELRERPDYQRAFSEAKPLVSICIPTCIGRTELLIERALPSALAQTYENIEVVVVGDAVGDDAAAAIQSVRDERVKFVNLTNRVAHPDAHGQWLNAAVMPRNEAHRQARGLWVTDLDDDDALRPDAIEVLLNMAQSRNLEVAYGVLERCDTNGDRTTIGAFPPMPLEPNWREKGMQWQPWQGMASTGALFHGGLRFFMREHVAAVLGMPGDFYRLERMVRAGVRFGMVEQIVYDYFPSKLWEAPASGP